MLSGLSIGIPHHPLYPFSQGNLPVTETGRRRRRQVAQYHPFVFTKGWRKQGGKCQRPCIWGILHTSEGADWQDILLLHFSLVPYHLNVICKVFEGQGGITDSLLQIVFAVWKSSTNKDLIGILNVLQWGRSKNIFVTSWSVDSFDDVKNISIFGPFLEVRLSICIGLRAVKDFILPSPCVRWKTKNLHCCGRFGRIVLRLEDC
jgi:hypothetical protein